MAHIPDLISLLSLDAKYSFSPFGGQHRTILISKDFTNNGDFVINQLLQNFAKSNNILFVTLSQEWSNYASIAAKCGSNLRSKNSKGNIDVLNIMEKHLEAIRTGQRFNTCQLIEQSVMNFIQEQSAKQEGASTEVNKIKPIAIIIDDISILLSIGCKHNEVFRLFSSINKAIRNRSKEMKTDCLSHLIIQTLTTNSRFTQSHNSNCDNLNHLVINIENLCDLSLTLKSLETGYSTRVDGTIKIVDNRLKSLNVPSSSLLELVPKFTPVSDIGSKKAFFFKVGERRVRLTSSALIF